MDDLLPILLGVPFGVFVFAVAWKHAGELPPGPVRPGTRPPPAKAMPSATVIEESRNVLLNGAEDAPELDAETRETIERQAKAMRRIRASAAAYEEFWKITNLED
jgi:hypothetical protein